MTRVLIFRRERGESFELQEVHVDELRNVKPFVHLDDCVRDVMLRGDCVKFDLHGLWWSVPMELNIHQVDAEISAELERLDCHKLPNHLGDTWRPTTA